MTISLFTLSAIPDVYADAWLTDDAGSLLFLSVWGRDTALQEFLARLQLPRSDNGIREFTLHQGEIKRRVRVPNVDGLDKITAKTPSHTVFGVLTHLWIYDQLAVRPDQVNHRALMLYDIEEGEPDPWPLFKTVCPLPMLDGWKEIILSRCQQRQWIRPVAQGAGIAGIAIELDAQLEPMMTEMIHRGELTLPENDGPAGSTPFLQGTNPAGVALPASRNDSKETDMESAMQSDMTDLFGDVIYSYTRADAIADAYLVDVSEVAREAGFRWPVALTRSVWDDCVEWDDEDSKRQTIQDISGRLWDVLFMGFMAIKQSADNGTELFYPLYRVPRGGRKTQARRVMLKLVTGPGDDGEPVVTIMMPEED